MLTEPPHPYVCPPLLFFSTLISTLIFFFFFFNDTATTEIYTLSLHDALPILNLRRKSNIELHEVRSRCGSPKICMSFTVQRASSWWTLKDTESFQRKSHPRFTTRFMPLCFPNSIAGEKRLRSCSRGSTCDWPCQSPLVMLSAEPRKRAPSGLPPCFTVKYALIAIFDS